MIIEFRFNSKSSAQNIPEAITIAERCEGYIDNKFYKIKFESPEDKHLKKLFELVGHLKGTRISIDGKDPVIAHNFYSL
ncbi:hypothetical protein LCGC14_2877600 [marine sediment metagenome]|uniref:Uncharacterized protein n=1 Tax=marine sediment metagenome TaxID=412755 RepID=A0A0F8Y199_9ZZZZ|nr:hypothetical protein [bacterium]